VALRTTGSREDAADGLQDGMVAAFCRAGSYRGDAAVTTWLHRVVVNACLDRMRAARLRAADALPDDLEHHAARGSLVSAAGRDADPGAEAEAAERRRVVVAALRTLPPEQRAAVVLVDMEGYPVAEAAAVLDCPVGTVKSRCARGRARLATVLGLADRSDGVDAPPGNPPPPSPVGPGDRPRGPPPRR
jgi:RNA polymerase sigma-70 factor (ECF subfamily)